jgi:hypothetical protein
MTYLSLGATAKEAAMNTQTILSSLGIAAIMAAFVWPKVHALRHGRV